MHSGGGPETQRLRRRGSLDTEGGGNSPWRCYMEQCRLLRWPPWNAKSGPAPQATHLQVNGGYGHENVSGTTGMKCVDKGFPNLVAAGPSIDQYIASKIGGSTPVPSLQLQICTPGSRDDAQCMSWAGADKAMPAEVNPYIVFAKLFNGNASPTNADASVIKRLLSRKRSTLDNLLEQQAALRGSDRTTRSSRSRC